MPHESTFPGPDDVPAPFFAPIDPADMEKGSNIPTSPELAAGIEAVPSIIGAGALAMAGEVSSPTILPEEATVTSRWGKIKELASHLNLANSPAGQALEAAGTKLSRLEVAKATIADYADAARLIASWTANGFLVAMGPGDTMTQRSINRMNRRMEDRNAGISNPVLRSKMAASMTENLQGNPILRHLDTFDRDVNLRFWDAERTAAMRRDRAPAYFMGAVAAGALVDVATKVIPHF